MKLLASCLLVLILIGCGKSKIEEENRVLRNRLDYAHQRIQDVQAIIESAKSDLEDLQDNIRLGRFRGLLSDLEDISDELDSAESELDGILDDLR